MRDEITSAEAGLTVTWLADRRSRLGVERVGAERRRRSVVSNDVRTGTFGGWPTWEGSSIDGDFSCTEYCMASKSGLWRDLQCAAA